MSDVTRPRYGYLTDKLPFISFGNGPRKVVVFPPISDALQDVRYGARWRALYYRGLSEGSTVYFVGRQRGLSPGYDTRAMAADYAQAFERGGIAPAHVVGFSLGGLVAQQFAADFPQHVESLVIGVAAHKLGTEGREIVRRWIDLARRERWRELYAESAVAMYTGFRRPLAEILVRLVGDALVRNPTARRDYIVSAEAALDHDAGDRLEDIRSRTLVLGGAQDRLFPGALARETARRIPGAKLLLIDGTGHGAFQERKKEFDAAVKSFVSR